MDLCGILMMFVSNALLICLGTDASQNVENSSYQPNIKREQC